MTSLIPSYSIPNAAELLPLLPGQVRYASYRKLKRNLQHELNDLYVQADVEELEIRFFIQFFNGEFTWQSAYKVPEHKELIRKLIGVFLASPDYAYLVERFACTPAQGLKKLGTHTLGLLIAYWSLQNYPTVNRLALCPRCSQRFSGIQDIQFAQFIAYSPLFAIHRLDKVLSVAQQVVILRAIAKGESLRKSNAFNLPLSRKMTHWMVNAPFYLTMPEALYYGIVKGYGGSDDLFRLFRSFQGNMDADIVKRMELIQFFVHFESRIPRHDWERFLGFLTHCYRDIPGFKLGGRGLNGLWREMEMYEQARRYAYNADYNLHWTGATFKGFTAKKGKKTYCIEQLTSSWELADEGRVLSHCVGSYARSCYVGHCSIWSLRDITDSKAVISLVTIEVDPHRAIIQIGGKHNRRPTPEEEQLIREWVAQEDLKVGDL